MFTRVNVGPTLFALIFASLGPARHGILPADDGHDGQPIAELVDESAGRVVGDDFAIQNGQRQVRLSVVNDGLRFRSGRIRQRLAR